MAEGESLRHIQMKWHASRVFPGCEVETLVGLERIADLVAPNKVVIECQASPLGLETWTERTAYYNTLGYAMLWLWDDRLLGTENQLGEYRVAAVLRHCHRMSYGRLYLLAGADVMACHLDSAASRAHEFNGESYDYYPKTLRGARFRALPVPRLVRKLSPERHILVECGDGVWWKSVRRESEAR